MNRPSGDRGPRVYLAGPEVFLPDPVTAGRAKQEICARLGLTGVYPLDSELDLGGLTARDAGLGISAANERLMRGCRAIIANLTPFRGPSADVGTAFEVGFMRALGRPVFAYSNTAVPFPERTREALGLPDGSGRDRDGMALEDFGLADNLMLDGAVAASGGLLVLPEGPVDHAVRFTDLSVFTLCVEKAARALCVPGG